MAKLRDTASYPTGDILYGAADSSSFTGPAQGAKGPGSHPMLAQVPFATEAEAWEWDALKSGRQHHLMAKNQAVSDKAGTQHFNSSVYMESLAANSKAADGVKARGRAGGFGPVHGDEEGAFPQSHEGEGVAAAYKEHHLLKTGHKEVSGKVGSGVVPGAAAYQAALTANHDIHMTRAEKQMAAVPAMGGAPFATYEPGYACQEVATARRFRKAPQEVTGKVGTGSSFDSQVYLTNGLANHQQHLHSQQRHHMGSGDILAFSPAPIVETVAEEETQIGHVE